MSECTCDVDLMPDDPECEFHAEQAELRACLIKLINDVSR